MKFIINNTLRMVSVFIIFTNCLNTNKTDIAEDNLEWRLMVQEVSIFELLCNKKDYIGREVITSGYPSFEYEDVRLYISREDYDKMNTINAISMQINRLDDFMKMKYENIPLQSILKKLNEEYGGKLVYIRGLYRSVCIDYICKPIIDVNYIYTLSYKRLLK